jgi:transposase
MWSETTRQQYRRDSLRCASDVTDVEWAEIEGFLPAAKKLGRPRTTTLREVVNALLYLLTTGCQWRLLPKEFPPFSTVQRFFYRWREEGLWQTINHSLVMRTRDADARGGRLRGQSQRRADRQPVGQDHRDRRAARVRCRQEDQRTQAHVLTDANGLLVGVVVHPADLQDRDGAPLALASARHLYPWRRHVFADGGYRGAKLETALAKIGRWTVEIVTRSDLAAKFVVLPRRWVVERTFAWLNRNRRLAKDFEATLESALSWLFLASVTLLMRRLGKNRTATSSAAGSRATDPRGDVDDGVRARAGIVPGWHRCSGGE